MWKEMVAVYFKKLAYPGFLLDGLGKTMRNLRIIDVSDEIRIGISRMQI
jgi:hypothetical protein